MMTDSSSKGHSADVPDAVSCKHGLKLQDLLHIKKEEEEPWESLEETDIIAVTVKSDDEEEEAQSSLGDENIRGEPSTCSSAKVMKVEPNGNLIDGPEAANTDGEETDCSEDWKSPSEAQSQHMSCENNTTTTTGTSHYRTKPFGCDLCGKRCRNRRDLKIHARIHTGEKPFSCEICGKRFRNKLNLKPHMYIHTGEKPYSCDVCGKGFTQKASLVGHVRVHTGEKPFGCDVCQRQFSHRSNRNNHRLTHAGEKPCICGVCEKRFTKNSDLNRHMRIHTGERIPKRRTSVGSRTHRGHHGQGQTHRPNTSYE